MRLVVFTDLDGTLLDHDTYSHAPALPALTELKRRGIPLILASSKTAAEIAPLHRVLQLGGTPAIVENGAGVFSPNDRTEADNSDYRRIRAVLDDLPPDLATRFRGFGGMDVAEIAQITGLSLDAAHRARERYHSEPGQWQGGAAELQQFVDLLAAGGIAARRGGRFLTLSLGRTKADAMREVAAKLGATVTVALGDAPNDAEMLEAADFGVVVRNDHAPPMPPLHTATDGLTRHTTEPGPKGWNAAVLGLLKEICES